MSSPVEISLNAAADVATLVISGPLRRGIVPELTKALRDAPKGTLTLDMSGVTTMDSAVVATLIRAWRARAGALMLGPMSPDAERALAMFRVAEDPPKAPVPAKSLEALGGAVYSSRQALVDFLQLAADTTFAVFATLRRPRSMRWGAIAEQSIDIGSRAFGIIGLITFLVGLTIAFQSAHQLQQFGAAIYVANLTGVSMLREMAPLMCAILVAGRSGSSIAAEIATMQVSEEIDALKVMGIDPIDFLAVPRILAITLMVPLLTVLADMLGILGGVLVGVFYLDIAPNAFINQMLSSVSTWDLVSGLIKSVVFAFGIGLIGLHYGFKVRGGASEVGRTTTASVVASIFFIIVADCIFSILFYVVV
ncbi:MAG: phospholipid/cholesterol/gamma-HCH transport system permease protein [Bradymonadia bacterium]